MAEEDSFFQLVTFQLGDELYGVDIMDAASEEILHNILFLCFRKMFLLKMEHHLI